MTSTISGTEKGSQHIETDDDDGIDKGIVNLEEEETVSYAEGRRIVHKVDRRLITALGLMFASSLIDRANVGTAAISGMLVELHLVTGYRFSIALLLFFPAYLVLQWPSALLAKKVGPRIFLPAATFLWGVAEFGMGFTQHWGQLAALRVVVGIFEAGLFPGALFLLQMWYCRYDVHKRYASFYLISVIGASLTGILAYGFMQMSGVAGYLGWRWIFIWDGVLTIIIAIIGAFLIVDFPQKAQNSWHFLKPHELAYIMRMLQRDRQDAHDAPFDWREFLKAGLDLKIWLCSLVFLCNTVIAYSIAYFVPIVLEEKMGFSVGLSLILSTPPNVWAGVLMFVEGWIGDKWHVRGPIIVFNSIVGAVGLCLMAWTDPASSQYLGIFLVNGCAQASLPTVMAYQANNIRGQWKRAFSSATLITGGATGGIIGALVFRSQDAPRYIAGMWTGIACCILQVIIVAVLSLHYIRMNRKVAAGTAVIEGLPGFRYTL